MSSVIRRFVRYLIIEGVLDSLKKRYADQGIDVDEIASHDPSPTKKYTPWLVKQIVIGANPNDLYPSVTYFDRHVAKFEKKDINAYRTAKDLEDAVKNVDAKLGSVGGENASAKIIAEDGSLTLEWLENKKDAWRYTNSSKWCITQRGADYFEQYTMNNVVFYVIRDRSKDPKKLDDGFAYAVSIQRDTNNEPVETNVWKQLDRTIKPRSLSDAHQRMIAVAVEDSRTKPKSVLARLSDDHSQGTSTVSDEEIEELLSMYKKEKNIDLIVEMLPTKFAKRYVNSSDGFVVASALRALNTSELPAYMNHDHVFVRVRVADRIDPSYLPQMMKDKDEHVREAVASHIDQSYLPQMLSNEKSTRVLVAIAKRVDENLRLQIMEKHPGTIGRLLSSIDKSQVARFMDQQDDLTRACVASHIDQSRLPEMLQNELRGKNHLSVLQQIAHRIDQKYYSYFENHKDPQVFYSFATSCDSSYLPRLIDSEREKDVRLPIVSRIDPSYLPQLMNDPRYEHYGQRIAARIDPSYFNDVLAKFKGHPYFDDIKDIINSRIESNGAEYDFDRDL